MDMHALVPIRASLDRGRGRWRPELAVVEQRWAGNGMHVELASSLVCSASKKSADFG